MSFQIIRTITSCSHCPYYDTKDYTTSRGWCTKCDRGDGFYKMVDNYNVIADFCPFNHSKQHVDS